MRRLPAIVAIVIAELALYVSVLAAPEVAAQMGTGMCDPPGWGNIPGICGTKTSCEVSGCENRGGTAICGPGTSANCYDWTSVLANSKCSGTTSTCSNCPSKFWCANGNAYTGNCAFGSCGGAFLCRIAASLTGPVCV
jgi:hypothetical protein